ncbi:MAG: hypothetical protein GWN93_03130 [Deltaproteobacteria bacterium]|nr:hypothetical protein [Deltaproteobacteria bacterium]
MRSYRKIALTVFIFVLLILGCASHEISEFNADTIKTITGWHLCLTDEMATYEKALDREESGKTRSKKSVLLKCDIKLRDDIAFYLTSKHKINLVEELKPTIGLIRADAECRWQHYVTLNIMIYDWKQNRLAKIEVTNGEDVLLKDDEKFAEYCADVIAKVISSP